MTTQTSNTGGLAAASRELITAARSAEEHNTPSKQLVAQFTLPQGHDTGIFPHFGRMQVDNLTEGEEIVEAQDLGMTSVSAAPSEVGGKVIMTDRLLARNVAVNFRSAGRQLGNAQGRKEEQDVNSLFSGLNGGTSFGAAGAFFSAANAVGCIGRAVSARMGDNLRVVVHPNSLLRLSRDLNVIGAGAAQPLDSGFSVERLRRFYTGIQLNMVPFFQTGEITVDSSDDGIGAIFDVDAMGFLTEKAWATEKQRQATLRAWVLVVVSSYVAFEMDDALGAPLTYDAATPATA